MPDYFIGIDGGGTSCRAAIADASGRILGRAKGGAANILTNPEGAATSIASAARAALSDAGLAVNLRDIPAFLGLAGANIAGTVEKLLPRLPFLRAKIESDGLIALQGAVGDSDGAVAILGTGTVYIMRHDGILNYTGGWGFVVGDLGSGARLGHALLQECLLVHDGIHPGSDLIQSTLAEFGNDPARLVAFAHAARPGDFGRYAPGIFGAAANGDSVAIALLRQAASYVDEALDAAARAGCGKICLLGGLAPFYPPWLSERHRALLVEAQADALTGAVALAISNFRREDL